MGYDIVCLHVARASMPGDDLLFHRLSDSTIGAVGFHGRVRNGIGWDTDAIATRQWSRCDMRALNIWGLKSIPCKVVVFVTNPSTARGLAIWRRLNHPHYRLTCRANPVLSLMV